MSTTKAMEVKVKPSLFDNTKFCVVLLDFSDRSGGTNGWVNGRFCEVYLRTGRRMIDGVVQKTVEVANITVKKKYQRTGIFNALLRILECNSAGRSVYIENLHDPALVEHFIKKGWTKVATVPLPSLFRKCPAPDLKLTRKIMRMRPPEPKPVAMHDVTVSMTKDTHNYLVRCAKEVGCHSVSDYLLALAGANRLDGSRALSLSGIALDAVDRRVVNPDIVSGFTFKSLFSKDEWSKDNFKTHQLAEELFRAKAWSFFGIELVAKYPNKYARRTKR